MTARKASREDDHFFRVEVTVNACIATPEDRVLGNNVADVTVGFSMSMARPPRELTDAEILRNIAHNVSPVIAALRVTMTQLGFAFLGTIDEPLADHSTPTGEFGKSSPVRVSLSMPTTKEARA